MYNDVSFKYKDDKRYMAGSSCQDKSSCFRLTTGERWILAVLDMYYIHL